MSITNLNDEIFNYLDKINTDVGYYWWKRYIYTAFWNNISTPINLSIIVLTALTTGQSATQNLITLETSTILGAITLFVSIFNSYFKPHEQFNYNQAILKQWATLGEEFDNIFYNRAYTITEKEERLTELQSLFSKVSSTRRDDDNNFCIDCLYIFIRHICIRNNITWLSDKELDKENVLLKHSLNTNLIDIITEPKKSLDFIV